MPEPAPTRSTEDASMEAEVRRLVDDYRGRCLWFLREEYYPATPEEILRVLDRVEGHGDLEAFQRAGAIRRWLLQRSNARSAGS